MKGTTRTILSAIFFLVVDLPPSADGFGFSPSSSSSSSSMSSTSTSTSRPRAGVVALAEREAVRATGWWPPSPLASSSLPSSSTTTSGEEDDSDDGATTTPRIASTSTDGPLSRRCLLGRAMPSYAAAVVVAVAVASSRRPPVASAGVVSVPTTTTTTTASIPYRAAPDASSSSSSSSFAERRDELLRAISSGSNDDVVTSAIEGLLPFGTLISPPSSSPPSYESALDGSWKLLWCNRSDFSPLLRLPTPFRPDSYQYFGADAEREVGPGRAAQGLAGGIVGMVFGKDAEIWLSSGVSSTSVDDETGGTSSNNLIGRSGGGGGGRGGGGGGKEKRTIVESDTDADFRRVNARDAVARNAPRNEYVQLYLEDFGSGSLRVSVIARGDPVISPSPPGFIRVAASDMSRTLLLADDGTVYECGWNGYGQRTGAGG
ncbi:hypothetical protein ACHAW5_004842 [Stephanodiscus triporus]|uniref:Plastid lipid-associated protein/fibrillin conserved domain-containing protein n=1 Tax=Stephanodiscus triporus TaxID=2934178 RepID=A0ABD3MHX9_9STRA